MGWRHRLLYSLGNSVFSDLFYFVSVQIGLHDQCASCCIQNTAMD